MTEDDRAPIDPHGPDFVYQVVADRIERRIRAGEFGDAGRLPSEADLAEWYGVAKMTMRRVHTELEARGLIIRRIGKGTFVIRPGREGTSRAHDDEPE
jgi:DNA-binding GntR family transcriptional regulator